MNERDNSLNLKSLRIEYVAGFFDGEGYAGLLREATNYDKSKYWFYVKVTMANRNKEVLERIQTISGGAIYRRKIPRGNEAICYDLSIYNNQAVIFLDSVERYLIVKKPVVKTILDYVQIRGGFGHTGKRRLPDEQQVLGDKYYNIVKELNRKGPK